MIAVAVGVSLAAAPTLAHHSRAIFDVSKNMTYRGVVGEYRWQSPHSHLVITYKPGDPITVVGHPSRDGSQLVLFFYAIKADGTRLYRAAHRYPGEDD